MAGKVEMCNVALIELNRQTITGMTDGTPEAEQCNKVFRHYAKQVLLEGNWSSSIRRASLNQTGNTPLYEFAYEYQLPTNLPVLKVIEINESSPGSNPFLIEDDKLLTDLSEVSIKYIADISDDPQYFNEPLRQAIVARLIAGLSFWATADKALAEANYQLYQITKSMMLSSDGQQGSSEILRSDAYTRDR